MIFLNRNRLSSLELDHGDPTEADDGLLLERYLRVRDQGAFEILIRRHGDMVFGTCLRILRNRSDAEDAFQAVFLVLLKKASGLTQRKILGDWLYGVAYHTALKARYLAAKRRARERTVNPSPPRFDVPGENQSELIREVLDQELMKLPTHYREAVVLCDLENLPRKEAASKLGIAEGTLSSRLTTGRRMLGERLSRRGIVVSGIALATLGVGISPELFATTCQNAKIHAGESIGTISPAILDLARSTATQLTLAFWLPWIVGGVSIATLALGLLSLWMAIPGQPDMPPEKAEWRSQSVSFSGPRFSHFGMGKGRVITISEEQILLEFSPSAEPGFMGIGGKLELSGDFRLEAAYEIIECPKQVNEGYGASLGILVEFGKPWGAINAQRGIYPVLGHQAGAGRHIPETGGTTHYTRETVPWPQTKGRLAIARKGTLIVAYAAEANSGPWKEIQRYSCPEGPTKGISFYSDPGSDALSFRARIFDVRLNGHLPIEGLSP